MKRIIAWIIVGLIFYVGSYALCRVLYTTTEDGVITKYDDASALSTLVYFAHQPLILLDHSLTGRVVVLEKRR